MKRRDSGELETIVVPRAELAPPASAESLDAAVQGHLQKLEDDRPTLVICPGCNGSTLVTPERAATISAACGEEETPCSHP